MDITTDQLIEELIRRLKPAQKYDVELTQVQRNKMYRHKKKAKAEGRPFDEHEWIRENVK